MFSHSKRGSKCPLLSVILENSHWALFSCTWGMDGGGELALVNYELQNYLLQGKRIRKDMTHSTF